MTSRSFSPAGEAACGACAGCGACCMAGVWDGISRHSERAFALCFVPEWHRFFSRASGRCRAFVPVDVLV